MLDIQAEQIRPGTSLIRLNGKLMMGPESASMESFLAGRLESGDQHLVFDLSGLKQIDSTGIGRFIALFNKLMPLAGTLSMADAQPTVRQAFRVTRLDTVFRFYDNVDAALAKLPPA
jgi:anti-sigma B factor antagonist